VASATTDEFALTRDVENARGDVFRRTYFHGGIDWRTVRFCVERNASDDSSGSWCEGIAETKTGSRGGARLFSTRLASFEREGALSLVASSSARARD